MKDGRKRKKLSYQYRGHRVQLIYGPQLGTLVVDASRIAYLNLEAIYFARALLEGWDERKLLKEVKRTFRGVSKERVLRDFVEVKEKLERFITDYVDPVTDLGFSSTLPRPELLTAPFRVDLALTYRCNNECVHCYSFSPREKEELSTEQWKFILRKLDDVGVPQVTFTGGEPTLRKDLVELVAEAQRLGMVSGIVTNGRLLKDKKLVNDLVKAGLDYAQVTLESADPSIHDSITRVKGSWEETVQGIKNLLEHDIFVDVNATVLTSNYRGIDKLVEFVASLGVDGFSLNRLIYSGRGRSPGLEPPLEEVREVVELAKDLAEEHELKFTWYGVTRYCELNPLDLELGPKFCSACSISLAIEPNGDVIPCQSHYKVVGNILRDPWDKIWYSDYCKWLREGGYAGEVCRSCPVFNICRGGCPLEAEVKPFPTVVDYGRIRGL